MTPKKPSEEGRTKAYITKVGYFVNGQPVGWGFENPTAYITVHDTMGTTIINGYTIVELREIYRKHHLNNNND